ncbi:enoyl-CoA hydratase [Heyndrickxia acidiproducens]|uniref:enoyl-CoA hydratase n=1 Tax=Heyndrickxia acidiproducens TaxID=1121084 RepID=UPI00037F8FF1|nr:enoyl-CoA hydratase [Heyndrickxia acidiproducens]
MDFITVKREDMTACIEISRPPANALAQAVLKELSEALDQIENDSGIRVVILCGKGRFFSAGADIKEFVQFREGGRFDEVAVSGQDLFERVESFPKPVIAAIHGAALGGGLELAMACHIRLVTENAKLGLPELKLGLVPGFAGTQRLPRYVGWGKAFEMLWTSEPVSGTEAVKWGLANHAYHEEELLPKAKELAAKIAKQSPLATKAVIELVNLAKTNEYKRGLKQESEMFQTLLSSKDGEEGIKAFIEKREPHFNGE